MNTSQQLYEQAILTGDTLTPDQENSLSTKYAILYAKNVVKRKLHGARVNQKLRSSVYAEEYSELPRPKTSAFDTAFNLVQEKGCPDKISAKPETEIKLDFPKTRIMKQLVDMLHDQFDCHPSMLNTQDDFDKLAGKGAEMKQSILNFLDDTECCPHIAKQVRKCMGDDDCGKSLIRKIYSHSHNWV